MGASPVEHVIPQKKKGSGRKRRRCSVRGSGRAARRRVFERRPWRVSVSADKGRGGSIRRDVDTAIKCLDTRCFIFKAHLQSGQRAETNIAYCRRKKVHGATILARETPGTHIEGALRYLRNVRDGTLPRRGFCGEAKRAEEGPSTEANGVTGELRVYKVRSI